MNSEHIVNVISNIVILSSIFPLGLFIYRYMRYSPWRTTTLGVSYLVQRIAMLVLMLFILASALLPDFFGREWIRLALYVGLVVTFWNDDRELLHAQKPQERKEK